MSGVTRISKRYHSSFVPWVTVRISVGIGYQVGYRIEGPRSNAPLYGMCSEECPLGYETRLRAAACAVNKITLRH